MKDLHIQRLERQFAVMNKEVEAVQGRSSAKLTKQKDRYELMLQKFDKIVKD